MQFAPVTPMSDPSNPFWRGVFSDEGSPSLSRVATASALVFALGWVTYLTVLHGEIPELGGITVFVSSLYALNRATKIFENHVEKDR